MNTKLHTIVDGLGNPVEFLISAGNDADSKHAIDLLKKLDITKSNILGDKRMVQKKFGRILQKTENPIQYLQNQIQKTLGHVIIISIKNVIL